MSCFNKQRFASREAALAHARLSHRGSGNQRHSGGTAKMRPYFCDVHCQAWHLTSMSKREQKRKGFR